jgi:AcrR family transcriptional regulator
MTSASAKAAPRPRRRNVDRSAETQSRLIEATIDCLNRVGYAGTTTILVSETSGVTRGGMLHHFPSKVDLMIGTAEACVARMREERRARQGDQANAAAIMEVERGRFGVALTEIILGSRSDAALAARFKPVAELILERQRIAAAHIAARNGVKDVSEIEVMVWVSMAAIRGMTLMELAGVDPGLTERALRMIGRNSNRVIARLKEKEAGG